MKQNFGQKVLKTILNPRRYIPVVNKSPIRYPVRKIVDWLHWSEIQERRRLAKPIITPKAEQIARELREKGYSVITEAVDPKLLFELQKYANAKLESATEIARKQIVQSKSFWLRLSDDDLAEKTLDEKHILTQVAAQNIVVGAVSAYLGEVPVLGYPLITYSQFKEGGYVQSQLWHQDRDDVRMVKMFVYLSDVASEADGPFTFLDKPHSERVKNSFFMRHLSDSEVFHGELELDSKIQMIYPALSVFLVDTSQCYHMGSRVASGHSRMMYTALYTPKVGIYPRSNATPRFRLSSGSSQLERLLLE